jgi:hypothetical protein
LRIKKIGRKKKMKKAIKMIVRETRVDNIGKERKLREVKRKLKY